MDSLYRGLPPNTYYNERGDKIYGANLINASTNENLVKELQYYLSIDRTRMTWATVTNIINLYHKLKGNEVLQNLSGHQWMVLNDILFSIPNPVLEEAMKANMDIITIRKTPRICEIM